MEVVINTKFWHFSQNNSGGIFVIDEKNGVCEDIIIEAQNPKEALSKLSNIGDRVIGFWDFCSCCGERWDDYLIEEEGAKVPSMYNEPISTMNPSKYRNRVFIHHYNGKIESSDFSKG